MLPMFYLTIYLFIISFYHLMLYVLFLSLSLSLSLIQSMTILAIVVWQVFTLLTATSLLLMLRCVSGSKALP